MDKFWNGVPFFDNYWFWAQGSMTTQSTNATSARVTAAKAHTGSHSLALGEPYPDYSGVAQTLTTLQGSNTTVSFWLLWDAQGQTLGAEENSIQVLMGGSLWGCWENEYPTSWTQYTLVYTAATTSDVIQILASVR